MLQCPQVGNTNLAASTPAPAAIGQLHKNYYRIASWRAPIFEDFEDFFLTSKILSLKFLAASHS